MIRDMVMKAGDGGAIGVNPYEIASLSFPFDATTLQSVARPLFLCAFFRLRLRRRPVQPDVVEVHLTCAAGNPAFLLTIRRSRLKLSGS